MRFSPQARKPTAKDLTKMVKQEGDKLIGSFIVVQPGRIRIGRKPGP